MYNDETDFKHEWADDWNMNVINIQCCWRMSIDNLKNPQHLETVASEKFFTGIDESRKYEIIA